MFARTVTINLKADSSAEFTRTLSFWDHLENADAYAREVYPEVLKALSKIVEGTPKVESYEVSNSTLHKIAAHVAA